MPPLLDDLPTLEDKLGWECELARLAQRIEKCPTPHVLGIHGNWGSGKTSFMRQLQWHLGGNIHDDGSVKKTSNYVKPTANVQIATVWFDAWRYQNEPAPVVALLHEMRRQIALLPAVIAKFKRLGSIALHYTLNSLDDVGKAIGIEGLPSADKIKALGESWEKEHHAQMLNTDSIRDHLHQTIASLLPTKNARVVVFIDDLDRCNPKAAIRLLEGLKIYLNIPNCVFILGMNESILIDAIRDEISAPKDATADEMSLRASHYLEKICTDIYRLPLPANSAQLFMGWIPQTDQKDALNLAIGEKVCMPPNPRRLKALANQWERFAGCANFPAEPAAQPAWAARALVAAYIHQFHRDIWERWHFNPDFWGEFMAWSNGEISSNANGDHASAPKWASALKLTEQVTNSTDGLGPPSWARTFPNPSDIDIFWMDSLVREYRDDFRPIDFLTLLKGKQHQEPLQ
jgi:molybdopterin-guanine dinucleotide biosynthesis protein